MNATPSFITVAGLLSIAGACATGSIGGARTGRFLDPDAILIDTVGSLPVAPGPHRLPPEYPNSLRERGISGDVVAVFVVDTSGRIEMRTVSFVPTRSDHGFRQAVCQYLRSVRMHPAITAGTKRRMLVVAPFMFRVGLPDIGEPREAKAYDRFMTTAPRSEVFADLDARPHC